MKRQLLAVLILLGLGLRVWWRFATEGPIGAPAFEVVIPPGATTQTIAEKLSSSGLLTHPWTFTLLVRMRGDDGRLRAGRYRFEGPYSLLDIEQKMILGEVERREVTFPEGRNIFEMAEMVSKVGLTKDSFLAAAHDPSSMKDLDPLATTLEGYLFPETYDVKEGSSAQALTSEMVRLSRGVFAEMGLTTAPRSIAGASLSLRQIVTLASIVELETAAPNERPRIAGVFLNRLRAGMKLQTDPTVIYALKLGGRYDGNIRKIDLSNDSPYNTYRFAGLPPGPIASPGRGALEAVLKPEATEALYFVSRNDGTHVFSNTLRDHERAVDQFQRLRTPRSAAASPLPPSKAK